MSGQAVESAQSAFVGSAGAALHYETIGSGAPVLVLHGAYSTGHETRAVFEPVLAPLRRHRRIYVDLPAMGDSPAHDSVRTSQAVVDLLDEFVEDEIGIGRFQLIGHSYGGHLARGLAARRPSQLAGLALVCPLMPKTMTSEPHRAVRATGDPTEWLDAGLVDEFVGYFVIHSREMAERFRDAVAPAIGRFDADRVGELMAAWRLRPDPDDRPLDLPALVVAGRHDSFVGYRDQLRLIDLYTAATVITVADAGHAVAHEHPDVLAALIRSWDDRCASAPVARGDAR